MKIRSKIQATQSHSVPINCHAHDYIEIACMYSYDLKLELRSEETLHVKAITTATKKNENGVAIEYLIADSSTTRFDIPLTEIVKLEVKNKSAKFQCIELESDT